MIKLLLKRSEVYGLRNTLDKFPRLKKATLSYPLMRNFEIADKLFQKIEDMKKPFESYEIYEKALVELKTKNAKKDAKGKPTTELIGKDSEGRPVSKYVFDDPEAHNKDVEALQEAHKPAIDGRKTQLDDLEEFAKVEEEFEFHEIKHDLIVDDSVELDHKQFFAIRKLIKD